MSRFHSQIARELCRIAIDLMAESSTCLHLKMDPKRQAVSNLPNDVFEKINGEEYPQEYMSPSPQGIGSVRPGDDPILTGSSKWPKTEDAFASPQPPQLPMPHKDVMIKSRRTL